MNAEKVNVPPTKRRDNDGLHKRRNSIWHYRLKIAGKWHEFSTHTSNYQEARQIRHQALHAQETGKLPTDIAKYPFAKAASGWLAGRAKLVAPQTYRIDKERLAPLLKVFGGCRLCDITSDDLRAYQLTRTGQVGPRTINLETKVLRMILKTAKRWAQVADEYRPLPENRKGPGRALAAEEEKRLFEIASRNPDWGVAYYAAQIAANTTARSCELKGLQLADLDLITRTMTVRRASTKTDAGCRIVPLNKTAAWAAARLLERARLLGAHEPTHYLFPAFRFRQTKNDQKVAGAGYDPTVSMKSWRTAWRSMTRAAGLTGLRFHDLRHHCITRLAEAGVAEQTLMAVAGHVSREMLEHYSHIRMKAKRDAVAALEPTKPALEEQQAVATVN